jgi:hypothetical protein
VLTPLLFEHSVCAGPEGHPLRRCNRGDAFCPAHASQHSAVMGEGASVRGFVFLICAVQHW